MNHLIDTNDKKVADPKLCASTSFVLNEGEGLSTLSSSKGRREQVTQLKFLETLIDRLLSTMGFRKTKTPNGCSAIIWDDQLLCPDTGINIHNSLQENELEEK